MCQEEDLVDRSSDIKQDQGATTRTQLLVQDDECAQSLGGRQSYIAQVQMNNGSVLLFETSFDGLEAICSQNLFRKTQYGYRLRNLLWPTSSLTGTPGNVIQTTDSKTIRLRNQDILSETFRPHGEAIVANL